MALETFKPQVPVDQDTDKVRGLEVLRSGTNAELTYNEASTQWRTSDDLSVNGAVTGSQFVAEASGGSSIPFQAKNGSGDVAVESEYNDGGSGQSDFSITTFYNTDNDERAEIGLDSDSNNVLLFYTDGSQYGQIKQDDQSLDVEFNTGSQFSISRNGVVNIATNNTQDTSGDVQVRGDNNGNLFSLENNDGLGIRYEGDNAFTVGYRQGSVGSASTAIGGSSDIDAPEASGFGAFAFGRNAVASGSNSFAVGFESEASGIGSLSFGGGTASGIGSFAGSGSIEPIASGDYSFAHGTSTRATAENSFAQNNRTSASGVASFAANSESEALAEGSSALGFDSRAVLSYSTILGFGNEEYISPKSPSLFSSFDFFDSQLNDDDRSLQVGVGSPDGHYDGRGRVDGLYVTVRNGTYIRHGLQIDRYDGSNYVRELRIPEQISSGSDTSEILVRNPSTNELEFVTDTDVASGAVSVSQGRDTEVNFNSSTGEFEVSVLAEGDEGDFQVKGADTGISDVDSGTTASYDSSSGAFTFGVRGGSVGTDSVALGGSADSNASVIASGKASTVFGLDAEASGLASIAGGTLSLASGDYAISLGRDNTASGSYSAAFNEFSEASGRASFAAVSSTASGNWSAALGINSTASAYNAFVAGDDTTASADWAAAFGNSSESTGFASFSAGNIAKAKGNYALAVGFLAETQVAGGAAFGLHNEVSEGSSSVQDGNFNTISGKSDSDRVLQVGAGKSSEKRDALYVTWRGGTYVRHGLSVQGWDSAAKTGITSLRIPPSISQGSDTTEVLVRNPSTNELEYVSSDQISSSGLNLEGGDNVVTSFNASTGATTVSARASGNDGYVQVNSSGLFGVVDTSNAELRYHASESAFTVGVRSGTVGSNSVVLGGSEFQAVEASGNLSLAIGGDTTASGSRAFAVGNSTTAAGSNSTSFGNVSEAAGASSLAVGDHVESRPYASAVFGRYNLLDQTTNSSASGLSASSKMLVVGTGEVGSREDGLYVTYGNGTYVKNGLNLIDGVAQGSSTDQILIRNPSTGQIEYVDADDITEAGFSINGGDNINSEYGSSTDVFTISVVASGNTNDFQLNDGSGLGVVSGGPLARYEGSGAFTFGRRTGTASANSVVLGGENNNENEASGDASLAVNRATAATGNYTFAAGNNTSASAQASASLGQNSTASGDYSLSAGRFALASGQSSVAFGDQTDAIADYTIAAGNATEASAQSAVSLGDSTTASSARATALGWDNTASGNTSTATGYQTTASGMSSFTKGSQTTAAGDASSAAGFSTISRAYGGKTLGTYNEDYLGSGGKTDITDLTSDDRMFAVGVGDNPSASSGDSSYYDGRGRVDGLYVTYRDGTHARHGFSVDAYNASLGQYETVFEVDETGSIVKGSVSVDGSDLNAAGPNGSIQYNDNDSFAGSGDFTFDDANDLVSISDGKVRTDVEGPFGDFITPVSKLNFPYATFNTKSDLDEIAVFDRPSAATIQSKFNITQTTDETLSYPATFQYLFLNETIIQPDNSQGYVDWDDTDLNYSSLVDFVTLDNVRGTNINLFGPNAVITVSGDETDIGGDSAITSILGELDLDGGGFISRVEAASATTNFEDFTGTVENFRGLSIEIPGASELESSYTVENAYGLYQEGAGFDNLFQGTVTQFSGALVSDEDNLSREYQLNQRTTDSAQAALKIDSQGFGALPEAQDDATWQFEGKVVARVEENTSASLSDAAKGDTHVWELEGVFSTELDASTGENVTRFVGQPVVSTVTTDNSVEDYSVSVSASDGNLEIQVQAENGASVNWTARLEAVELVA